MNYTYLVQCADGTLYCGWTNHLEERVKAHNSGKGAKYTKSRRPVKLVYYEEFETKEEAMRREFAVKQLTRQEKQKMIEAQRLAETQRLAEAQGLAETQNMAGEQTVTEKRNM